MGRLSRHLIASFYVCDADGVADPNTPVVLGAAGEINFDMSLNWQSPFEQSGPEAKAPALMALIQSGQLGQVASALQARLSGGGDEEKSIVGRKVDDMLNSARRTAEELEGRTGITKLNSRQIFSGMPPVKITLTLHLRAFSDPETEVMQPYQTLLEWSLPQQLAKDGLVTNVINDAGTDNSSLLKVLFPSKAPLMVGFKYGNNRYSPMVIEAIGHPLDGPIGATGLPLYRAMNMTLATLTALDRNDVAKIFSRGQ